MQQIPLTWFLQAFYRENHIWDWEHWVISPGRRMRDCWKSSRQSAYFYFLFSMWKACTSQYHSIDAVAKLLMHHLHFPGRESYSPFTVIISILYPKRPSERGLRRPQEQRQQLLSFWISVSEMDDFRAQNNGYFAQHLLPSAGDGWSTGSGLVSMAIVPLFVLGSQGCSRVSWKEHWLWS